jgi:hypothetical protein
MNTTVTGPLAGAARVRPHGWLATPLTTETARAEARVRALICRHHPAAPGPVRCLSARYRTATFTLGHPPRLVLKQHGDQVAYLGEVLAYQLLEAEHVLPQLHDASDARRTLIVDFLGEIADIGGPAGFEELIAAVTAIHTASARWPPPLADPMSSWRLSADTFAVVPAWVRDPAAWRALLQETMKAHGEGHVPLGHLDLKADHCRRRADGRLALIDAETLRPDLTGMPDLITLAFLASHKRVISPARVRRVYRRHTNNLGARWSDAALVRALRAFATATGLISLHGVDQ